MELLVRPASRESKIVAIDEEGHGALHKSILEQCNQQLGTKQVYGKSNSPACEPSLRGEFALVRNHCVTIVSKDMEKERMRTVSQHAVCS